jgi:hypothetical protein
LELTSDSEDEIPRKGMLLYPPVGVKTPLESRTAKTIPLEAFTHVNGGWPKVELLREDTAE